VTLDVTERLGGTGGSMTLTLALNLLHVLIAFLLVSGVVVEASPSEMLLGRWIYAPWMPSSVSPAASK
jgi:hypothetical protein